MIQAALETLGLLRGALELSKPLDITDVQQIVVFLRNHVVHRLENDCVERAGCCMPAVACWVLSVAYWLLSIGYWLLSIVYCLLAIGYWLLAIGYWLLSVVYCLWSNEERLEFSFGLALGSLVQRNGLRVVVEIKTPEVPSFSIETI
jgi:hypothetical protein